MDWYDVISQYFWLFGIAATTLTIFWWRIRTREYVTDNATLEDGYERLFWWARIWLDLPWVVMGVGSVLGGVPTAWHFFRPREANPFVLSWYASVLIVVSVLLIWVFRWDGAETLVVYRGIMGDGDTTEERVKKQTLVIAGIVLIGMLAILVLDIPAPSAP